MDELSGHWGLTRPSSSPSAPGWGCVPTLRCDLAFLHTSPHPDAILGPQPPVTSLEFKGQSPLLKFQEF